MCISKLNKTVTKVTQVIWTSYTVNSEILRGFYFHEIEKSLCRLLMEVNHTPVANF